MVDYKLSPDAPRVLFLGLGGAGANLVGALARVLPEATACARQALRPVTPLSPPAPPACLAGFPGRTARRAELVEAALTAARESGAEVVVLLAGLGGHTGGEAIVPVAQALQRSGVRVIAGMFLPFAFEGRSRGQAARTQLCALAASGTTECVVENQDLLEACRLQPAGDSRSLLAAFRHGEEMLLSRVRAVLGQGGEPPPS